MIALSAAPAAAQCPFAPILFTDVLTDCNYVRLTWNNTGATQYRMWVRDRTNLGSPGPWLDKGTVSGSTVQFDMPISWITRNTFWGFRVDSEKSGCPATASNETEEFVPLSATTPTSVSATPLSNGQVRVNWNPNSNANSHARIFRDGGPTHFLEVTFGLGSTTFTETCGSHSYQVQGRTPEGCTSTKVPTGTIGTWPTVPTLATPADGATITGPNITFTWNQSCAATSHGIQIADNVGFASPLVNTSVPGTTYVWTNAPSGTYYWHVRGCNANCSNYSAYRSFTVPLTLIAPNGGENWPPGSTQTVLWSGGGTIKIELFADVTSTGACLIGPSTVLAASASGGSYSVTVPSDLATTRAKIQISRTTGAPSCSKSQNPFTIATPPPANVWSYDPVDGVNHGWNQSDMCGNGGNGVEAVYFDYLGGADLRRASKFDKTAEWVPEIVASTGSVGSWPSIIRAGDGRLHVAYYDHTLQSAKLYYITRDPATGQWSTPVLVAPIKVVQGDCSIALQNNVPYIAFNTGNQDGSPNWMKMRVFKQNPGGTWSQFGITIPAESPHHITLRAEPFGNRFWLSYIDQGGARMNLWIYNGVNWLTFPVTFATGPYTTAEVTLDPYEYPQLAYTVPGTAPGSQKLLFQPWALEGSGFAPPVTLDASLGTISSLSMEYNYMFPRIGYVGNGVVKLAIGSYSETEWPCTWSRGVVDATGNMDSQVSLVVGLVSDDKWLLYRDLTTGSMRAARPYWVDTVPPAASPFLNASGGCENIYVSWQATGDDGNVGTATSFDLRWSSSPITTDAAFNGASAVPVALPAPGPPGTNHEIPVYMGECSAHKYFGLKIRDNAGNLSPLTGDAYGAQTACIQPPAQCWEKSQAGDAQLPLITEISSVGPNPTSRSVAVNIALARGEVDAPFDLSVFDVAGRRVAMLHHTNPGIGRHTMRWDLRDTAGREVSAGIYFVRLHVASKILTKRVVVVR